MNRTTLATRLYAAFGLLAALLLLCAGLSWRLASTASTALAVEQEATLGTTAIADAQAAIWAMRHGVAYYMSPIDAETRAKVAATSPKLRADFEQAMDAFASKPHGPAVQAKVSELREAFPRYAEARVELFKLLEADKIDEATELRKTRANPAGTVVTKAFAELIDLQREEVKDRSGEGARALAAARMLALVLCAAGVVAAVIASWRVVRSTMRQLGGDPGEVTRIVRRIADGDLDSPVPANTQPDSLLGAMGDMQTRLRQLVGQIEQASSSIATGSSEIASGNADLSQRTEAQAGHVQQTASAMSQLTTSVQTNADAARQATELAGDARAVAERGGTAVNQVVATMGEISSASKRIADITGVIDGIAFQTNILALNAAVEAARAGEQGRGFAVVATEVRSLAQRSAAAAKEIKGLIGASVERVEAGSAQVDAAGRTMQEIVQRIQRVNDLASEISHATSEQRQDIERVGSAMIQIDQTTQQNSALVEQSAAAAESLRAQTDSLVGALAGFRRQPALA
ncbi:MAG TPA: methyl-accepting chemotaxis protein [Ideonella sp.]|uniref:methyl-accepting chemotaxis protein n=1 Tax=Ideonella sp. TaxID=1929293 RepID=UPI002C4E9D9B|nr:methyl-accepting chemotaxis protein [Ideonella sp.]HSI47750.1 methyl-accepting chemotaxis protein [Ideonella sp.]